jgi:hypothetical protein
MFDIVNLFGNGSNQWVNVFLLSLAMFRIYLEVIDFNFQKLPLTKNMFQNNEASFKFHRSGLYLSVGYILFWAPFTLFS